MVVIEELLGKLVLVITEVVVDEIMFVVVVVVVVTVVFIDGVELLNVVNGVVVVNSSTYFTKNIYLNIIFFNNVKYFIVKNIVRLFKVKILKTGLLKYFF